MKSIGSINAPMENAMKFTEGQRVVVSIRDENDYSRDAGRRMHGHAGVIEKVQEDYVHRDLRMHYLVAFDEPVPSWHSYSADVTAFWFVAHDLKAEVV